MPKTEALQTEKWEIPLDVCLDVAGVMILFLRPDGRVGLINRRGSEILGYSEEEIVGRSWFDSFLPRRSRSRARRIFRELIDGNGGHNEFVDGVLLAAGGDERRIRWHNAVVRKEGVICGTLSSGLDVTEYEESEAALREIEARSRAILDTTVDAIITADERGNIESFNPAAENMFGYSKHEIIGRRLSTLMPPPYCDEHDAYMRAYLETGRKKIIGTGREVVGRRKDGTTFPLDLAVSEFVAGGRRTFTGVLRDISERRKLEREVLRISEDERERIGRDLHDGLGSLLSGTAMGLHALIERTRRGQAASEDDLERIAQMIEAGAQQAHLLSRGLSPVRLENEGLVAALTELTGNVRGVVGIICTLDTDESLPPISQRPAMQLYRIAQEAVTNAVKHSHATRISVELNVTDGHLNLTVRDDGIGFTERPNADGMGMNIMPYRARLFDGHLNVDAGSGGTSVTCLIPLDRLTASE